MKLATTTGDFARFFEKHEDRIRHIYEAGFRYIDMDLGSDRSMKAFMAPDWKDYAHKLREFGDMLGVKFIQAHSMGYNTFENHEKIIRSLEVCRILGIPDTVVHAGVIDTKDKYVFFEENLKMYRQLFPAMEANQVNVLIENTTRANLEDTYYFLTGEDMKEFLDYANHPLLHACWDTGHANVEGHQYSDICALGKDLYAVHINDNRGAMDEHLMPYNGTMCLDEVMQGLTDSGYKGYFTFEASSIVWGNTSHPVKKRSFTGNSVLQEPPLFLKTELEKLLYRLGEHILKSYGCFEE